MNHPGFINVGQIFYDLLRAATRPRPTRKRFIQLKITLKRFHFLLAIDPSETQMALESFLNFKLIIDQQSK